MLKLSNILRNYTVYPLLLRCSPYCAASHQCLDIGCQYWHVEKCGIIPRLSVIDLIHDDPSICLTVKCSAKIILTDLLHTDKISAQ